MASKIEELFEAVELANRYLEVASKGDAMSDDTAGRIISCILFLGLVVLAIRLHIRAVRGLKGYDDGKD